MYVYKYCKNQKQGQTQKPQKWFNNDSNKHWYLIKNNPEYSLEGLMLKLKLQYFWPPDEKSQLTGKDPHDGWDWGQEKKGVTEDAEWFN